MNLQTFRYAFGAGETRKITVRGRFVRGMGSDETYLIRLDDRPVTKFQTGIAFESPEFFSQIEIENGANAQTIEIMVSDGFVDDNRLVGQVDISGGIRLAANRTAAYGAVTVGTGAVEMRPENTARGSLLLQNNGAAAVFVGTDNAVTTGNGVQIGPGGSVTLTINSAVYAISGSAGNSVRWLEETL